MFGVLLTISLLLTHSVEGKALVNQLANDYEKVLDEIEGSIENIQDIVNDQAYKKDEYMYHVVKKKNDREAAKGFCEHWMKPMSLVTIHSKEEMDHVNEIVTSYNNRNHKDQISELWLGLDDIDKEGTFKWIDGIESSYTNWRTGEPNNFEDNEDCVAMMRTVGTWNDYDCKNTEFVDGFICKGKKKDTSYSPDDYFYHVSKHSSTFEEAKSNCAYLGMSLASINTQEEMNHIAGLLYGYNFHHGIDKIRIGLSSDGEKHKWLDGSELSYTYWRVGPSGLQRGVEIITDLGLWQEVDNDEKVKASLCKKRKRKTDVEYRHDKFFYQLVEEEKNFIDAQKYCAEHSRNLVTIHSQQENEHVKNLARKFHGVVSLIWIGYRIDSQYEHFSWVDNSADDFKFWSPSSAQTNSLNQNNKYAAMEKESGEWERGHVTDTLMFICKGERFNECDNDKTLCSPNGTCVDTPGSFRCDCDPGFFAEVNKCKDIDECTTNTHDCHKNAKCTNNVGSYGCQCNSGYIGDGKRCIDVNECEYGSPCGKRGKCVNTGSSYKCECDVGFYFADGTCKEFTYHYEIVTETKEMKFFTDAKKYCEDNYLYLATIKNEYENRIIKSMVPANFDDGIWIGLEKIDRAYVWMDGTVIQPRSSFNNWAPGQPTSVDYERCTILDYDNNGGKWKKVACKQTMGFICQGQNDCHLDSDHCSCTKHYGSFLKCKCDKGYRSSKHKTCVDIDECASAKSPCGSVECVNTQGSYICKCAESFQFKDGACIDATCRKEPEDSCKNGGECEQDNVCKCSLGFISTGDTCKEWLYNYKGYIQYDDRKSYQEAKKFCSDNNMSLLAVQTKYEQILIKGWLKEIIKIGEFDRYWIGLEKLNDGAHKWIDGKTPVYLNWDPLESTRQNDAYKCVMAMGENVQWLSEQCQQEHGFICQGKNQCKQGAYGCKCTNHTYFLECKCDEGYHHDGESCIKVGGECSAEKNSCEKGYICENKDGKYNCVVEHECKVEEENSCKSDFKCKNVDGRLKCVVIGACEKNLFTCFSGYNCVNTVDSYKCVDIDECQTGEKRCPQGEKCENTEGSYRCSDIDECSREKTACEKGYECQNTHGSFRCIAVGACEQNPFLCGFGRKCVNTQEGHKCVDNTGCDSTSCQEGFKCQNTDGDSKCVDIDECKENENACSKGLKCENTEGSFKCIDIDECKENENACSKGFKCENTEGSFKCIDIDECKETANACSKGLKCENTEGSFKCIDIDECKGTEITCSKGFKCENTEGSFKCIDIDECKENENACSKGLKCENTEGSFKCIAVNECNVGQKSCGNGYKCENIEGTFKCVDVNECKAVESPCKEGYECTNTDGSYKCINSANKCDQPDICRKDLTCKKRDEIYQCVCEFVFTTDGKCLDFSRVDEIIIPNANIGDFGQMKIFVKMKDGTQVETSFGRFLKWANNYEGPSFHGSNILGTTKNLHELKIRGLKVRGLNLREN